MDHPGNDTQAAFGHPEGRLAGLPPGTPVPDRISLRDHIRSVEIGAFEGERGVLQRLLFDVAVEVAPPGDARDDVDRILSYDRIGEAIEAELGAGRVALLETLADGVARRILREPQALRVILRIQKLDRGPGALGVEVVRERQGGRTEAEAPLRPRLLVLGDPGAPGLAAAVRALLADAPLLVVAPPVPSPEAATPEAQGRVDLLAADQGAWLLAAGQDGLAVAGSLTEIDWLLRRGRAAVWAPARVSLDEGWGALDHLGRALRLGARLGAREVVTVGLDAAGSSLPTRRIGLERPFG